MSATDDWKTFTLNNRHISTSGMEQYPDSRTRMIREKESYLDSQDLTHVRDIASNYTAREAVVTQERERVDEGNVHIMTLELQKLPPNVDE